MLKKFKEWFDHNQKALNADKTFYKKDLSERVPLRADRAELKDGLFLDLRFSTTADIPAIVSIQSLSFSGDIPWNERALEHEIKRNTNAMYLIAYDQKLAVAFIGAWFVGKEAHITNIAVIPNYRRNGIAAYLIQEVQHMALLLGMKEYSLEVRVSNTAAIELYKRLGFVEGRIKKEYYASNREDALEMNLML